MTEDQIFAQQSENLNQVINMWRESLERKQERHGEHFDPHKAIPDLWVRFKAMPHGPMAALLAAAIDRLAHMEDYDPVPAEISNLDFETPNVEELMKDVDGE